MAFTDQLEIRIRAGRGGNGVVRWRHEKHREFGGPAGGDGGKGGDVYVRATRGIHDLSRYASKSELQAENGTPGENYSKTGKGGEDLVIEVPLGTIVTNTETQEVFELLTDGQTELIASGGVGGYGNEHFKGATNQRPDTATPGQPGEEAVYTFELHLIADIGCIGLPSAGKSSLLNALTNATAKTGAYHFTTLEPNLGVFHGHIIADIPGLISGAHTGRGLGYTFLRHITRTRFLIHLVSVENDKRLGGPGIVSAYQQIRDELAAYDPALLEKAELVVLSKADMLPAEEVAELQTTCADVLDTEVYVVSSVDETYLTPFTTTLSAFLHEHTEKL